MALETVDILIQSDDVVPVPLDGVVVRVYDATGTTLLDSGTTGAPAATGHVEFTLNGEPDPSPDTYQLRFYLVGASIPQPQLIEVYSPAAGSPTGTNNFQINATLLSNPTSPDPLLCRVSGYIRDPSGRPKKGLDIGFIPNFSPLVAGGQGVLGERIEVRTDKYGYVEFDLFRLACYQATVESMEDIQRVVTVPDRPSLNVNYLLFPVVTEVVLDPVGPFALTVGSTLTVTPAITASNFQALDGNAFEDVIYSSSDESVFTVETSGTEEIILRGIGAGSATLEITRKDSTIVYVPDPGITGGSIAVTVT